MLSTGDLQELESSLLPALERHHLRLLAHSLRCLQQAAGNNPHPPSERQLRAWAEAQPGLCADAGFIPVLLEQLQKAQLQLEQIASWCDQPALSLSMSDLLAWGHSQADQRLGIAAPGSLTAPEHTPPATPAAPPADR
jgi:hypothetical protein